MRLLNTLNEICSATDRPFPFGPAFASEDAGRMSRPRGIYVVENDNGGGVIHINASGTTHFAMTAFVWAKLEKKYDIAAGDDCLSVTPKANEGNSDATITKTEDDCGEDRDDDRDTGIVNGG